MSGSDYTTTPNLGLFKPTYGMDDEQWGDHLNQNSDKIDTALGPSGVFVPFTGGAMQGPLDLTGTSTAWTAGAGTNTTQIATTAFVNAAVAGIGTGVVSWNARAGAVSLTQADVTTVLPPSGTAPQMDGTAAAGTATAWSRSDHVHPTDTSRYAASNPAGYQTAAQAQAAVAPAFNGTGRNLIHNPLFNIAQRGAGPFIAQGYTLDRWIIAVSNDTVAVSRGAANDAMRAALGDEAAVYVLGNTFTGNAAAAAYNALEQPIEGLRRLSGKTVTLSFWAVCSAGTLKLGINYLQNFGTGGSPSVSAWANATGQSVTISTAYARYAVTTSLPSTAGMTMGTNGNDSISLAIACSSGATSNAIFGNIGVQSGIVNIWGVQLEIGSVATPLEKPDPRYDLANCQRFAAIFPVLVPALAAPSNIVFPVTMRGAPVITGGGGGFTQTNLSPSAVTIGQTAAANQTLTFSADL